MLHCIEYTSVSLVAPDDRELLNILAQCDRFNQRNGITGFLHFDAKRFHQVLEGPYPIISGLYKKILNDPRHNVSRALVSRIVSDRRYLDFQAMYRPTLLHDLSKPHVLEGNVEPLRIAS